ncbi:MAG: DUF2203 domain-containing protein [Chloroflexi bacterium]|nr:DUF2203 domain-containing protein [Chloroflexota bacterium]
MHYYSIDEANGRIAEVRQLLERLREDRDAVALAQQDQQLRAATNGSADHAQDLAAGEARILTLVGRMKDVVAQLDAWDVQLRDIGTGLIDFPALANGRPIWLCWRLGEPDEIRWWHELETGFGSRQPLAELT